MATILCVDDDRDVRAVLDRALVQLGHRPLLADTIDAAFDALEIDDVDLILTDYQMPGGTGLDLLMRMKASARTIPVIVMTGYSSIEHAVLSIKSGATDYLTKPILIETLDIAVQQALEVAQLRRENEAFHRELADVRSKRAIVGDSSRMQAVMETIAMVAPSHVTVLLQGESGTGKELVARAIHDSSPRRKAAFVSLNCAALPEGLVESALFGHEKGAFTGATEQTAGAFERADRGTLLLDEISEMRLDLQPKLLRVIQEKEFERVGGSRSIKVDVRLIATTNQNLKVAVNEGRFRSDLYYRLNVVPICLPPLRERVEDIPLLLHHFAHRAATDHGLSMQTIPPEAVALLETYDWPGNVRELANAVERAVILSVDGRLSTAAFERYLDNRIGAPMRTSPFPGEPQRDLDHDTSPAQADLSDTFRLRDHEKILIKRALIETGGNRTRAAQLLGISERTLRNKLNIGKPAKQA